MREAVEKALDKIKNGAKFTSAYYDHNIYQIVEGNLFQCEPSDDSWAPVTTYMTAYDLIEIIKHTDDLIIFNEDMKLTDKEQEIIDMIGYKGFVYITRDRLVTREEPNITNGFARVWTKPPARHASRSMDESGHYYDGLTRFLIATFSTKVFKSIGTDECALIYANNPYNFKPSKKIVENSPSEREERLATLIGAESAQSHNGWIEFDESPDDQILGFVRAKYVPGIRYSGIMK